jgi:hypothetical protein
MHHVYAFNELFNAHCNDFVSHSLYISQEIIRSGVIDMTDEKIRKTSAQNQNMQHPQTNYEIKVQGHLDSLWAKWFEGMSLTATENGESGMPCTLISGPVTDQAALHGLLIKVRDLNLILISVRRVNPGRNKSEHGPFDFSQ